MTLNLINFFSSRALLDEFIGHLLGDGGLVSQSPNSAYFTLAQTGENPNKVKYVDHIFENYKFLCTPNKGPKMTKMRFKDKHFLHYKFSTRNHKELKELYDMFYIKERTKNRKILAKNIEELLTPRVVAYWFMDDGSAHDSTRSRAMELNTHGFTFDEILKLSRLLTKKFGIECWPKREIKRGKSLYRIYISGRSYDRMLEIMNPYYFDSMRYKLPQRKATQESRASVRPIKLGRFLRLVEKQPDSSFLIIERILDENESLITEERTIFLTPCSFTKERGIKKNNASLYFEEYCKKYVNNS